MWHADLEDAGIKPVGRFGNWLTNVQTKAYDLGRPGPWQHLVAFVETTPNTAGGHLANEKGGLEGRFDASLALDDVRFELLESP